MAKIRGIKPDLWTDEDFTEVSPLARLLWLGMWNYACDNGHLQDRSKQIKLRVLPTDNVNCSELLTELTNQGLIERDSGWITVPNLTHHQKPNRRYFTTCEKPGCSVPAADPERKTLGAQVGTTLSKGEQGKAPGDGDGDGDGDGELMVSGGKPRPASRKRPAKPLPTDWHPTDEHAARCEREGIDIKRAVAKFKAHAEANDRRQANWNASFTQWLLNEKPSPRLTQPPRDLPHASQLEDAPDGMSDDESWEWMMAQRAKRQHA